VQDTAIPRSFGITRRAHPPGRPARVPGTDRCVAGGVAGPVGGVSAGACGGPSGQEAPGVVGVAHPTGAETDGWSWG